MRIDSASQLAAVSPPEDDGGFDSLPDAVEEAAAQPASSDAGVGLEKLASEALARIEAELRRIGCT